ncbi:hypothetical protein DFH09DRAFT_1286725 [Mycena vulgaris]|nr:hypothetical protein DFH09DRAFT_1286725 [Mycena vulgaris]
MCNALQGRRHGRRGAIKASARFLLVRTVACSDALQRRRRGGRMGALRLGNTHTFLPANARSGALPGGRRRRNARKRDTRDRCRARRGTLVMGAGPDVLRRRMRPSVLGTLYNHFVLHVAGTGMLPRLAIGGKDGGGWWMWESPTRMGSRRTRGSSASPNLNSNSSSGPRAFGGNGSVLGGATNGNAKR